MFSNKFNTLYNTRYNCMFNTWIFTFGIFTYCNKINICIWCLITLIFEKLSFLKLKNKDWYAPSRVLHGRTLANKLNCLRKARLSDWWPLPTAGEKKEEDLLFYFLENIISLRVANGPLRPIRFLVTDSIARRGIRNFPSG